MRAVDGDVGSQWELVWRDDFDGPELDRSKWSCEVNAWGGGNNELQYYTDRPENVRTEHGCLVIEAREEDYDGPEGRRRYTSARIRTAEPGAWLYGRFEASIKLPCGQGIWPAFWMMPTDNLYGAWPTSGEIDIVEAVNLPATGPGTIYGALHFGDSCPENKSAVFGFKPGLNFSDEFQLYAVEWAPGEIRWYVNDLLYAVQTDWESIGGAFPAPFDQRFHLLLNVAVGGNWPGEPDAGTVFPQQMRVDYVRVLRRRAADVHGGDDLDERSAFE